MLGGRYTIPNELFKLFAVVTVLLKPSKQFLSVYNYNGKLLYSMCCIALCS